MLIAAIPKSGSTALMETIGRAHTLNYTQLDFDQLDLKGQPFDETVAPLWILHGDLSDLKPETIEFLCISKSDLFKQHITPSDSNLKNLADKKIVVLLRKPEEIIESYYRGFNKNIHIAPKEMGAKPQIGTWIEYAKQTGMLEALKWWNDRWNSQSNPNWLIVTFDQIVNQPGGSIALIEQHFNLPPSGIKELVKARYSKSLFIPFRYNRKWRDRYNELAFLFKNPRAFIKSRILKTLWRKVPQEQRLAIKKLINK